MSNNKDRVATSPELQKPKIGQEEIEDLDSGFVSGCISTDPFDSCNIESSEIKQEDNSEKNESELKKVIQTQEEQQMDSAYMDSGLLSSDMSKLEINPQIVLQKQSDNEVYFQCNEEGDTLLHLAIIWPHVPVAKTLIKLAPNSSYLNIQNDLYLTPMHLAVLTEQAELLRDLLIGGAKTTVRDRYGNTALHLACQNGFKECVRQLLTPLDLFEKNRSPGSDNIPQDLELWNRDGETCIHLAAKCVNIDIIKMLVAFGADVNAREGKQGRTVLHKAVEEGDEVFVQKLLKECPKLDIDLTTYAGLTAYQIAFANSSYNKKHKLIAQVLLKHGADSTPMMSDDSESEDKLMPQSKSLTISGRPVNVA